MEVTTQDISRALIRWAERDLLAKGNPFQQGISTFVFLQAKPRLDELISGLNMLTTNGKFDFDELTGNMRQALQKMGGSYTLPVIGYTIDGEDLNNFFNFLRSKQ